MKVDRTSKPSVESLDALCRRRGGRLTPQRRAVLEALLATRRPLTAYEIRDLLREKNASMTPASTYRSLEFLIQHGLVHRLETTNAFIACENPYHEHAGQFLICRRCGTVVEAEDRRIARVADELGQRHGFALDHSTVELTGVCASCAAR